MYCAVVLDAFSRRVVGWSISHSPTAALTTNALGMAMSRLDATSMLWRLRLEGVDVGDRFEIVARSWNETLEGEGGFYAFNDFHAAMAFAATGRQEASRRLRAALEKAAWEGNANGEMTRVVGMDVCEAFIAFGEGRYAQIQDLPTVHWDLLLGCEVCSAERENSARPCEGHVVRAPERD